VKNSNFRFNEWNVKPKEVNLIIDEDDNLIFTEKLVVDTDGTGPIGWILFNKSKTEFLNTTVDTEKPMRLSYNDEYKKSQKYYLSDEVVYQFQSKKCTCFFEKTDPGMKKINTFLSTVIIFSD